MFKISTKELLRCSNSIGNFKTVTWLEDQKELYIESFSNIEEFLNIVLGNCRDEGFKTMVLNNNGDHFEEIQAFYV